MADRNKTRIEKLAKQYGAQPAPIDVLQNNEMHRALYEQYANSLGVLRLGRREIESDARTQIGQIKQQRKLDVQSAASSANERGVLGSSQDVTTRDDIRRAATSGISGVRTDKRQALLSNWAQVLQERNKYELGVLGLQQNKAAAKAMANAQALENDLLNLALGGNGGGKGGGNGRSGGGLFNNPQLARWAQKLAGAGNLQELAARIEKLKNGLFDVTELGGYQAGVTGPHSGPGSRHHTGLAFDANTTRGNNTDKEAQRLQQLFTVLEKLYNMAESNPNEANSSGSGIHGHGAFWENVLKLRKKARKVYG